MRVAGPLTALALLTSVGVAPRAEAKSLVEIPFEILRIGSVPGVSNMESKLIVAHNQSDLRHIWSELHVDSSGPVNPQEVPDVDFDHSVVVAFFGALGDNCDPYRLTRVIASPEKLILLINHRIPGINCTCGSVVFEPYIIVRVTRTEKPTGFQIEDETHDCR
jgi:hypothetical protein